MSKTKIAKKTRSGLTVVGYPGDNMVLLALSLDKAKLALHDGFAEFAIRRTYRGKSAWLMNRLSFEHRVTKDTTPE